MLCEEACDWLDPYLDAELDAKHVDTYTALYSDLKGDVLAAQGKNQEARAAYQVALDKSDSRSGYRALVQVKLDALGAAK